MQKTIGGIEIFSATQSNRVYSINALKEAVTPRQSVPLGNWGMTQDSKVVTGNVSWKRTRREFRLNHIVQPLSQIDKYYFLPANTVLHLIGVDWLKRNRKHFKDEQSYVTSLKLMSRNRLRNKRDLANMISAVKRKYLNNASTIRPPFECRKCSGHVHAVNTGDTRLFGGRNIYDADEPTMTLVTGKALAFIQEGRWRYATETERERLMGMPDQWTKHNENPSQQRVKQTGNAVVVPVVQFICERIIKNLGVGSIFVTLGGSDIDPHAGKVYDGQFKGLMHQDIRTLNSDIGKFEGSRYERVFNELGAIPENMRLAKRMKFVYEGFCGIGGFMIGLDKAIRKLKAEANKLSAEEQRVLEDKAIFVRLALAKTRSEGFHARCDIFCGGFPCQPFSSSGKREGFGDQNRGSLFFEILGIVKEFEPAVVFLENVKGLLTLDQGRAFRTVICELADIGYEVEWQLINSRYLIPQDRERIYIVAHRKGIEWQQVFPATQTELELFRSKLGNNKFHAQIPISPWCTLQPDKLTYLPKPWGRLLH